MARYARHQLLDAIFLLCVGVYRLFMSVPKINGETRREQASAIGWQAICHIQRL
jgi:hypothetical protein